MIDTQSEPGSWKRTLRDNPTITAVEYEPPADISPAGAVATDQHNAGHVAAVGVGLSFHNQPVGQQ